MNIIVYPEKRVLKGIIKKWKIKNPDSNARFYIYGYKFPYKKENIEVFDW
jgi:hypothetical protein